ncbi:hypothetical protein [Priestia megaterium]|uniref:hypothetical protein n=1 Tax=Priestia megaterium TaxID=1404 RepID=UPI0021163AA2|nr:hypothetical protein [Priestia megaterium]MED4025613.1 hypothetical protein [Priestia megaterium]
MIEMTQDFIANEFGDFNKITSLLITALFNKDWNVPMRIFFMLGSRQVLVALIFFTLVWILWKGRDKKNRIIISGSCCRRRRAIRKKPETNFPSFLPY